MRVARQHEAEKKVEELDALLAVSREITATLDLDKVMGTIVNATSTLIPYERCAIGIFEKGRLRLGAVSGAQEIDRKDPERPEARRAPQLGLPVRDRRRGHADGGRRDQRRAARDGREVPRHLPGDRTADLRRRPPQGRGGQARRPRIREHRAPRLRRGDAGPARDPRQPGDRRGAQCPALPAGAARRIPAASPRETPPAPRHPGPASGRRGSSAPRPWPWRSIVVPWRVRVEGPVRVLPAPTSGDHARRSTASSRRSCTARAIASPRGTSSRPSGTRRTGRTSPRPPRPSRSPRATWRATRRKATPARCSRPGPGGTQQRARKALAEEQLARDAAARAGLRLPDHAAHGAADRPGPRPRRGARASSPTPARSRPRSPCPSRDARARPRRPARGAQAEPLPRPRVFRGTVERVGAELRQEGEESFVIAEARVENPGDALRRPACSARGKVSTALRPLGARSLPKASALSLAQDLADASVSARPRAARSFGRARSRPASTRSRPSREAEASRPALKSNLVLRRVVQMGEAQWVVKNPDKTQYYSFDEGDAGS